MKEAYVNLSHCYKTNGDVDAALEALDQAFRVCVLCRSRSRCCMAPGVTDLVAGLRSAV
jgi:hypothetical protein